MSIFDPGPDTSASGDGQPHASVRSILASLLSGGGEAESQTRPGVEGLVQRFEQAGLGGIVHSWIGGGQNQEADPAMLRRVLGEDQVEQWAQQAGVTPDDLLSQLSQFLPNAISQMTPDGEIAAAHPEVRSDAPAASTQHSDGGAKMGGPER